MKKIIFYAVVIIALATGICLFLADVRNQLSDSPIPQVKLLASLLMLPGLFYGFQFYKAKSKDLGVFGNLSCSSFIVTIVTMICAAVAPQLGCETNLFLILSAGGISIFIGCFILALLTWLLEKFCNLVVKYFKQL